MRERICTVCPEEDELEGCAHFGTKIIHLRRYSGSAAVCGPGEELAGWVHLSVSRFDTFTEAEAEFLKREALLLAH